jgi:hypothetical protein
VRAQGRGQVVGDDEGVDVVQRVPRPRALRDLDRGRSRRVQAPGGGQPVGAVAVAAGPRLGAAGADQLPGALVVDAPADAVGPAEGDQLVQDPVVGEVAVAGGLLVRHQPHGLVLVVVAGQPLVQLVLGGDFDVREALQAVCHGLVLRSSR